MFITKANPKGGRPLTCFPISEDPKTGFLGYKIGYCQCGCNEPLLIRTIDLREIVDRFAVSQEIYDILYAKKEFGISVFKRQVREKLIKLLGGSVN